MSPFLYLRIAKLLQISYNVLFSLIRLLSLSVYMFDKTGTAENKVKSL